VVIEMDKKIPKKPTMFEASKKVMGLMEDITARQIICRLKDYGRKEVPTPRQLAQKFRSDPDVEAIRSKNKKHPTIFRRLN
jgi:hypothetical protein